MMPTRNVAGRAQVGRSPRILRSRHSGIHALALPQGMACVIAMWLGVATTGWSQDVSPPSGVPGVTQAQLDADYWIRQQSDPDELVLAPAEIASQNQRLRSSDPSVNQVEKLPPTLDRAQVRSWIESLSAPPAATLYDESGEEISARTLKSLSRSIALDRIPTQQQTRYGLVTRRANLRTFPTELRVFNQRGNTDIDRFQENALFPGTPVALVHESKDGDWWFVVSGLYEAWIEKHHVAEGSADAVFGYGRKSPYLVVTGNSVRTVYTPEQPQLSDLQLDMGVRVPLLEDWPADRPVNGQHPSTAYVIELPVREKDGALAFSPALLPRAADVARDYLPLRRDLLLRQGFKFLGERYGWGHSYNARDCSGFVSEVYRSFGVELPRNTGDQARSPAFDRMVFDEGMSRAQRLAIVRTLQVGDLVYIPGHVMMVIGHERGDPYVIHDTTGIGYIGSDGALQRMQLNGVVVTPLVPLMSDATRSTVDRITTVQRIRRPSATGGADVDNKDDKTQP